MKKIIAMLLVCVMLTVCAVSAMSVAAADNFVPSVVQDDDLNSKPSGDNAPQTGEELPVAPIVGAAVFGTAAVGFFVAAVALKKKKNG